MGAQSLIRRYLEDISEVCVGSGGHVAEYIPELATADPDRFGLSLVVTGGYLYAVGDAEVRFTIQSMSKPLTYALALVREGAERVDEVIGVEPSGEAFNEVSVDRRRRPKNAMINAGAISAAALILARHGSVESAWAEIVDFYSAFAGRGLQLDHDVYVSERETGSRNRAIAWMLKSFDVLPADPEAAIDLYFRQCSLSVTSTDLAVIGSTLANGGVNPRTGRVVVDEQTVRRVLSVMTTCGMYDAAGDWVTEVGLPAKSGVSGGILAVLPGQLGIGVYGPRLDGHGNSVSGVAACKRLSEELGLHMFTVARESRLTVRGQYDGRELAMWVARDASSSEPDAGDIGDRTSWRNRICVLELQGDLRFAGVEAVLRRSAHVAKNHDVVILDATRVDTIDNVAAQTLLAWRSELGESGLLGVVIDPDRRIDVSAVNRTGTVIAATAESAAHARVVTSRAEALAVADEFLARPDRPSNQIL